MEVHCCSLARRVLCHVAFRLKLRSEEKSHSCIIIFFFILETGFHCPFREAVRKQRVVVLRTRYSRSRCRVARGDVAPAPSPQSNEAATPTPPRGASRAEAGARPPAITPAMLAKLFFFFFFGPGCLRTQSLARPRSRRASKRIRRVYGVQHPVGRCSRCRYVPRTGRSL